MTCCVKWCDTVWYCPLIQLLYKSPSCSLASICSFAFHFNTDTPEAACIRCRGGTARGWCASHHHHHLLFLRPLQYSSPQPIHKRYDGDFPPGCLLCSLSIATAFFVQLRSFSWGCALMAEWTSVCCGSSQQWVLSNKKWMEWLCCQGDGPSEAALDINNVSHLPGKQAGNYRVKQKWSLISFLMNWSLFCINFPLNDSWFNLIEIALPLTSSCNFIHSKFAVNDSSHQCTFKCARF